MSGGTTDAKTTHCHDRRGGSTTTSIEQQLAGLEYDLDTYECRSPGEAIEAIKEPSIIYFMPWGEEIT